MFGCLCAIACMWRSGDYCKDDSLPLPCESQNLNSDYQPLWHLTLPADTSPSWGEKIPTHQNCSEYSPGDNDFTLCLKLI